MTHSPMTLPSVGRRMNQQLSKQQESGPKRMPWPRVLESIVSLPNDGFISSWRTSNVHKLRQLDMRIRALWILKVWTNLHTIQACFLLDGGNLFLSVSYSKCNLALHIPLFLCRFDTVLSCFDGTIGYDSFGCCKYCGLNSGLRRETVGRIKQAKVRFVSMGMISKFFFIL